MRKPNTLIIILFLVCLAFVLGSKTKTEHTKWEYAYYKEGAIRTQNKLVYLWKEPNRSQIYGERAGFDIAKKLKIKHGLEKDIDSSKTSMWLYSLFQYAGQRGWELVSIGIEPDGIHITYWFKRPKID